MTALSDIQLAFRYPDAKKASMLQTAIQSLIDDGPTDLDATWDEINAVADMSSKIVAPATGNLALSAATHANRVVYYDDADGTITLPAASGSGNTYKIVVKTAFTAGVVNAKTNGATFLGGVWAVDDDADAAYAWKAETNDNTMSFSGTATGGKAGDWLEFLDVATNLYLVSGFITQSGGSEATPFSAT